MDKKYIFTGTPGSGKSSVAAQFKALGYRVIPESATDIIALEQDRGIIQPWNLPDFIDKIIISQKQREINTRGNLQFYDRSPFCTYALGYYLSKIKAIEFLPSVILTEEINRCLNLKVYQNKVFFFQNLGFIAQTRARTISYQEALIFEKIHLTVYQQFGFDIILVPQESIKERSLFILHNISL